jgi:hypothetical protein
MNQNTANEVDRVNRQFNYDIREKGKELSRLDKHLYNLSLTITVNEWKLIRGSKINELNYWEQSKGLSIEDKRKLLINRVSLFLQSIDYQ